MSGLPHKPADIRSKVIAPLRNRWSPRRFDASRPVSDADLAVLLDAARWAPSSFNEQPWRYLCGRRGDPHRGALDAALMDGNVWARRASVLLCSMVKLTLTRNGKPNRVALHDLGLANMSLITQATAMGMITHPMGGFDAGAVREAFAVPEDFTPVAMLAVGWHDPAMTDADLIRREESPRVRRELGELVFGASFGDSLELDD